MTRSIASTLAVTTVLSSAALLAPIADAHQIVLLPEPTWTTDDKDTKYNPLAFLEGEGFTPQEDFTAWRIENGYKSLRDFMDNAKYSVTSGADSACGFTDPNGTPQPIPEGNAMRSTGYTHDGPCEVWIDDTLAMGNDNCHEAFPGKDYTIDYSACKGTCTLRWYWLGVRFLKNAYSWQVYKACIPLTGPGGGTPETSGSVVTTETTEAPEVRSTGSHWDATPARFKLPKKTWLQTTQGFAPILRWLPQYQVHRDLKLDIVAGITVPMMLIPQEVSLSTIMNAPAHHELYTATTAPLVYTIFVSSTALSVTSCSEVPLLVDTILEDVDDQDERVATGIMMAFLSGCILLLVRILNLNRLADFFSHPGFISAGGILIMLPQFSNAQVKIAKDKFFSTLVLTQLFESPSKKEAKAAEEERVLTTVQPTGAEIQTIHCHGFALTDQQCVRMETTYAARHSTHEGRSLGADEKSLQELTRQSKGVLHVIFLARAKCDLGPLVMCIFGGIVDYELGPPHLKLTGTIPGGFPSPEVPWYGFTSHLIAGDKFDSTLNHTLTVVVMMFLSSVAMAKRLGIQRGEDINTDKELTGLGIASVVCGFFQAMLSTGGMSCAAMNLMNAHTQLASIITCLIVILALYTLTGTLHYPPNATLASIIIVAGYSLVESKEAKWLYLVKRDEFAVWTASFILTLGLGVLDGLIASIVCSILALMSKTKVSPVIFLGELDNGILVDPRCVVDDRNMNGMDATTIQVMSDTQEKLAVRKVLFAIVNAKSRAYNLLSATNCIKHLLCGNPSIPVEEAVRILHDLPPSDHNKPRTSDVAV
ncbi:hypothetical protein JM16_008686 [Phytophthora kernoviae]|uniref:SLC26A/SulP transporter domain-containing protein n=1 Tax=Phytophthora kernoviae TaxID=325452 RepID=A0A8T0LNE3_9STRA|nr:hypothetical protein JM16_008686 [Phytophthora kernoviae]